MAKFCPNCGLPLDGAPKFCPSCGTPLMAAPQQEQKFHLQRQPQQQMPPQGMQNTQPQQQMPPHNVQAPPRPQQMPPHNVQGPPRPKQMPPQGMQNPQMHQQMPPQGMQNPQMRQQMPPQSMQNPQMQQQMPPQGMQNPHMQQQMPPMMQGSQGQPQPMMYQNAPAQNFGQQPYGAWQGPNVPNTYGQQGVGAFSLGPLGTDESLVAMFLRYDGRLNRKPYIFRALAIFGVIVVISIILGVVGAMMKSTAISMLGSLFSIVAAVPGIMLMIRRLHDLDRPTWWVIGGFIPLVNVAFGFYLLLAKGTTGPNQYGPDPLEGQY